MGCVLVVDDDASFVASLADALADEPFRLLTAQSGVEALALLAREEIDLVLTDIAMPRMDGIQLIRALLNDGHFVPCIVMTAYGTPQLESRVARLGGLEFINKPIDLAVLKRRISKALASHGESSVVRGIGLAGFLQLLAAERKTCTVAIKTERGGGGLFFLRDGELVDASTPNKSGVDAALELLMVEHLAITLRNGCRPTTRTINEDLNGLLLEAFRLRDEGQRLATTGNSRRTDTEEEVSMALEAYLQDFREVKGYIASGIMDFTGEILASDSANPKVDLAIVGAVFNDIFRSAHEASTKIGLEACKNLVLSTPRGIVVMECSGVDSARHVHMIAVLEEGGNQALVKMTIGKVLPKIVTDLT